MKAVILAGGRGTRLGNLTDEVPKPMISVGGKPLLHHQIDLLSRYGITEILILVNYLKEPIISFFGNGKQYGVSISYVEEKVPLGTTGGIKEIEDQLKEDFLVFYGDVMIEMDLARLISFHRFKNSECTLVLHPNDHPYDSDLVEMNEEARITAFHSKPHKDGTWYHNMVNAGAYILSPSVIKYIQKGKKADFGKDIFPLICNQVRMYGYHTSEYLKDMGTPDRLERVNADLLSQKIAKSNLETLQRAVFLDRDGVMNVERSYISNPDELEIYDFIPDAIRKLNHSGILSVVVTNQSAIARNLCSEDDVRTIHKKLETVLGEKKAWLDDIYFCPHHPDKGFPEENPIYKIDCDCRKPRTGMFRKAIMKFNIDPSHSFMIGDSERDIQAGINAGLTTIGVRTGYGMRKTTVFPDYMFDNAAEAIDFITMDPFAEDFQKIYDRFLHNPQQWPWIILIGGNTRTGKSTLASYLRIAFQRKGIDVVHVGLDNWLLKEEQRSESMNVYERFQLSRIEKDIPELISGKVLSFQGYVNHPQGKDFMVEYKPNQAEILIVEGVVALGSQTLRNLAGIKIFTTVSQDIFSKRIYSYYDWRGKSRNETIELIKKREKDEYQLIEKESKLADLIINSSGS